MEKYTNDENLSPKIKREYCYLSTLCECIDNQTAIVLTHHVSPFEDYKLGMKNPQNIVM